MAGDRVVHKYASYISAQDEGALTVALDQLSTRAHKQREILDFFLQHLGEEYPLTQLVKQHALPRKQLQHFIAQGLLQERLCEEYADPYQQRDFGQSSPLQLTPAQEQTLIAIIQQLEAASYGSLLLHGVTGSGKTEIYLQAIARALALGKEIITLVPEISLTPQMVERFKARFGPLVAVLHSRLSASERYAEWRKIRLGQAKIAIGARSAIFAPFSRLGLVIIDEEHEPSYKQEESPKYDARQIATWRCRQHGATLLLGSATPSLQSYLDTRTGQHQWLELTERVLNRQMPAIKVVDMRQELLTGNRSIFSKQLKQGIEYCLDADEQAIIFLNRRGFATFVMCRECGEAYKCVHCDISLTYHRSNQTLRCHYCGYATGMPKMCPDCKSEHIRHFGTGTQKIEEELKKEFEGIRVIRMDVDTTSRKGAHERLLTSFGKGQADVLVGTQMIAKGLDFPKVTLVGVISADMMLNIPDYAASERAFQLLMQVAGRAGRHELPGEVVIQTYTTDHYSITTLVDNKVEQFYRQELLLRKQHRYPPFYGLLRLTLSHIEPAALTKLAAAVIRELQPKLPATFELLGPVPAMVYRMKDRVRLQILLKYPSGTNDLATVMELLRQIILAQREKEAKISLDMEYTSQDLIEHQPVGAI